MENAWVAHEIRWSLEKGRPNGLIGIRLTPTANIPADLYRYGVEILEWYKPEDKEAFQGAIERAVAAARRAPRMRRMPANSETTCARAPGSRPPSVAVQLGPPSSNLAGPQREQLSNAEVEAIEFAVDAAIDGWQQAVAGRLADTLAEKIWITLGQRWRPANCQVLAEIARKILELKDETHGAVGKLIEWLMQRFERSIIEREVACALVKKIPLLTDAPLVETAQTLRLIGIYICLYFGDLSSCQCLEDLADDLFEDCAEDLLLQELQKLQSIVRSVETSVKPQLTKEELEEIVRNVFIQIRTQRNASDP